MHECHECGTACDCDGDDLWGSCPIDHDCINPDCGKDFDLSQGDEDDDGAALAPAQREGKE